MTFLARLAMLICGDWADLFTAINDSTWFFGPGGRALLFIGLPVALVLSILCYARTTEGLSIRSRAVLSALRFTALALLLIMLSGVTGNLILNESVRPRILVIVDDSGSMELPGAAGTRAQQVADVLAHGLHDRLANRFDLVTVTTSGADDNLSAGGAQDLAQALIRQTAKGQPPAAIVLLTDGSQIGPNPVAQAAAELPAPTHVLVAGKLEKPTDLILRRISVPAFVYASDQVRISAEISTFGLAGEAVLQLMSVKDGREKELANTKVVLPKNAGASPVHGRLEFSAGRPGIHHFRLKLVPLPGEVTEKNNEILFHLDVRPEKIKVLFIEGEPSWEYRYIRNALESDPVVKFYGLIRLPGEEWLYQGDAKRPDGKPVIRHPKKGFPSSADELNYFDVIILGDLERKLFEQNNRFAACEEFVRNRGGGLVTIGGKHVYSAGMYEGTALARISPFIIERQKKQHLINRFNVAITSQALRHPLMQLEGDPVKNLAAWNGLPWVEGGNAFRAVKPSATLLMVHPELRTKYGPRPVAAAWQYGAGRVYATALDGTWHWKLAKKIQTDYHRRFWGLVVRWLANDPRTKSAGAQIYSEDAVLEVGRPANFAMTLRDDRGTPRTDAKVSYVIEDGNGRKLFTSMRRPDLSAPGRYGISFVPKAPGVIVVRTHVEAGETQLEDHKRYLVAPSRVEYLQVEPDLAGMTALATASGGQALPLAEHDKLDLKADAVSQTRQLSAALWRSPGMLILLFLCLGVEWLLRKRRGLG